MKIVDKVETKCGILTITKDDENRYTYIELDDSTKPYTDKWERLKEEIKNYMVESDTEEYAACEYVLNLMEQIEKE